MKKHSKDYLIHLQVLWNFPQEIEINSYAEWLIYHQEIRAKSIPRFKGIILNQSTRNPSSERNKRTTSQKPIKKEIKRTTVYLYEWKHHWRNQNLIPRFQSENPSIYHLSRQKTRTDLWIGMLQSRPRRGGHDGERFRVRIWSKRPDLGVGEEENRRVEGVRAAEPEELRSSHSLLYADNFYREWWRGTNAHRFSSKCWLTCRSFNVAAQYW